jgi:multidrug efflux pump subunit AcrB
VAEIYGPDDMQRMQLARKVRLVVASSADIVDSDDSSIADTAKTLLVVDKKKAALLGVSQAAQSTIEALLKLSVDSASGKLVPIRELVSIEQSQRK